ncbi:hypothetical protein G7Y89_g9294 [Cudoniella acicularis]|uniref:Uncharacterized protein n=1 Tax=Cudoniella acicularis TaxID=354080 RepID=A0A8H4RIM4_9HELO|nr:hypothetical protein G7Y89_g9294 [Cudoniella acicularis]
MQNSFISPNGYVGFGKLSNCTLSVCDIRYSVFEYRPSLAANSIFLALFALSGVLHLIQGFHSWKSRRYSTQWFYCWAMVLGCVTEIIGYLGRILMHSNPFDFNYFLIQIVCLTIAPAFFSAAIYITLGQCVTALKHPRTNPKHYAYIFIPSDIISLTLQGAGGGLSSGSAHQTGVNLSLAGLAFQVFSLTVFSILALDWIRYWRSSNENAILPRKFKVFAWLLIVAVLLILARCAYRIDELSEGYDGSLFHDQTTFIVLEGVFMSITAFMLNLSNPSYQFDDVKELMDGKAIQG